MSNTSNTDLENNRFYKITQNISWFLIITFWFALNYIPLILFSLFVEASITNVVWYLAGLVPLGPALGSLIAATIRVVETDDFSDPRKDFFRYYRQNFVDSLKIWLPYLLFMYLAFVNINYYFNIIESGYIIGYLYIFIVLILTLCLVPIFIIQMNFEFRYKDLLKLSMYYFFTRIKTTFGNLFTGFIVGFLILYVSEWLVFVIPAFVVYFLILYNYEMIKDVKDNFVNEK